MVSILTLTLNPALDVTTAVDVVTHTSKLRCDLPRVEAGGGGVNVARVATRLGEDSLAIMPLSGANGRRLAAQLDAENVDYHRVEADGETRQSFSVTERSSGHQYRFVVPGTQLPREALRACREAVTEISGRADARCLVISGSMPEGIPDGYLAGLVEAAEHLDVIVDTSGTALHEALRSPAKLVKPSARELASVVGRDLYTEAEVEAAAVETMSRARCEYVAVSIGSGGALLVDQEGTVRRFRAPTVRVESTIGAGDSMVAGIALTFARGGDIIEAVSLGIATGTAAVMTPGNELCDPAMVAALRPYVRLD